MTGAKYAWKSNRQKRFPFKDSPENGYSTYGTRTAVH